MSLRGFTLGVLPALLVCLAAVGGLLLASRMAVEQRQDALLLDRAVAQAQAEANDFLRTRDLMLAARSRHHIGLADSLRSNVGGASAAHNHDLLHALQSYRHALDALEVDVRLRGVDEQSGSEGLLRSRILDVEGMLRARERTESLVYLLSARRREKDYLARREARYVAQVHAFVDSLRTTLGALPDGDRAQASALLDDYEAVFDDLVVAVESTQDLDARLREAGRAATGAAQSIVAEATRRADMAMWWGTLLIVLWMLGCGVARAGLLSGGVRPPGALRR
ncbi:MAG: hypothetical protein AAGF99_19520, partial [Bacteroidota bacterium]